MNPHICDTFLPVSQPSTLTLNCDTAALLTTMAVNMHSEMPESHKGDTDPPDTRDLMALRNQKDSPLLRLPAELKRKIYAYVSDHTTALDSFHEIPVDMPSAMKFKHDNSGLLLACRQSHYEAKPYIKTHQYMTWCGGLAELGLPDWIFNIEMAQIKEIVVAASQNWERDYGLGILGRVFTEWHSLRYIEQHRNFTRAGQEEVLDNLEKDLARMQANLILEPVELSRSILTLSDFLYPLGQRNFEVCIKCKEGKAVWTYHCEDGRFISSWEPSTTV
jgi:hypothetical protein